MDDHPAFRLAAYFFVILNPFSQTLFLWDLMKSRTSKEFAGIYGRASLLSLGVYALFAVTGEYLFVNVFQVRIDAFRIFGGLIVFIVSIRYFTHGGGSAQFFQGDATELATNISIPFMVGPATIWTSILIGRTLTTPFDIAVIAGVLSLNFAIVALTQRVVARMGEKRGSLLGAYFTILMRTSALFIGAIGMLSLRERQQTGADYLLASQGVKPWLVALSAVATNNSGYMFIGMIGFTYTYGLSSIWLMIGWITGDFLVSLLVHQKLRIATEESSTHSFAGALSMWQGTSYPRYRLLGGILTVIFLGAYSAAQLNAGSKALFVVFGWEYGVGAVIGAVIVLLYCFAGGIRASIWTDAAQSMVMIVAMAVLLWRSLTELGGWQAYRTALGAVSPGYMDWFPPDLAFGGVTGPALFVLGWFFAGAAVIGQPHIMIRFMAMDNPDKMWRVRSYYYAWFTAFYAATIAVGLAARLLLPESAAFDAELALPTLANQLLPPVLTGLVLAGLFAATISTADSLILSCTAAVTRDTPFHALRSYRATKLATVFVTALALVIALSGNESVFSLVLIAWSALASAFGPLMIVYALDEHPSEALAIGMTVVGVATVIIWRSLGLDQSVVYEVMPGMLSGLLVFAAGKMAGMAPTPRMKP